MKTRLLKWLPLLCIPLLGWATPAWTDDIILHSSAPLDSNLVSKYHLTVLSSDSKRNLYRLGLAPGSSMPATLTGLNAEAGVVNAEPNSPVALPATVRLSQSTVSVLDQSTVSVLNQSTVSVLDQSTVSVLDALLNLTPTSFYGTTVTAGSLSQPAMLIVENNAAHSRATGQGILIADIDNGVDPNHPALRSVLVPGYNFLNDSGNTSVFADLSQSTVSVLNEPLDLSQSTVSVLDQSTVSVLNQSTVSVLDSLPPFWGHGTEVAGVLHLTAPQSQLMPLKAFGADGTGALFNVIRAIYYAVDQGARVINMSFSCDCSSKELDAALDYAKSHGVVLVAAVGNDGANLRLFPAAYSNVIGVASTNFDDTRAFFSNYGSTAYVSAPGWGVVTAYPGGKYAAVNGTSFSTPIVAGESALLLELGLEADSVPNQIAKTAIDTSSINQGTPIGHGRVDLSKAMPVASLPSYFAGDVAPSSRDDAGSFGDGVINNLDLITALRAVLKVPGYRPAVCSDRFDAMDAFPPDNANGRGGDGALNNLDLLTILRRVTQVDSSRPRRTPRAACTASEAGTMSVATTASDAAATLDFGSPQAISDVQRTVPVYLVANRDLMLAGFSFSVGVTDGSGQTHLRFTASADQNPTLVDAGVTGAVSAAWLDGFWLRAGDRVLLGSVQIEAPDAATADAAQLQINGTQAENRADGSSITLAASGAGLASQAIGRPAKPAAQLQ